MDGRGTDTPVSRRDLGIALSWYGRFELYEIVSLGIYQVPPDLTGDDYGTSIASVITAGWMLTAPDGAFHPDLPVNRFDLMRLRGSFFPDDFTWDREWIGMDSLDSLFETHSGEYTGR